LISKLLKRNQVSKVENESDEVAEEGDKEGVAGK
jgi:hypothetical protein